MFLISNSSSNFTVKDLLLLLQTVRFLKPIQVWYQLWYRLKKKLFKEKRYSLEKGKKNGINWKDGLSWHQSQVEGNSFEFLNLKTNFPQNHIDWNYPDYGKLWTYNLNYFDWLHQPNFSQADGVYHIHDYIEKYDDLIDGKEPYPTSLRIINWVKYVSVNNLDDYAIHYIINQDSQRLANNLEYHLLANHLLENAFALVFGGYHLKDKILFDKGRALLLQQLKEQILEDGAHYELSPMYHQLMFYRVLDTIHLIRLNKWNYEPTFLKFLESIAIKMKGWLEAVSFTNGDIPLVNDSAKGINPETTTLIKYANRLKIKSEGVILKDSGYRKLINDRLELLIDVSNIKPSYQPGHAHADTFSFDLYADDLPFIVDMGTSTYDKNKLRHIERSTSSHNTVSINNENSSNVWGGFRVASRAEVKVITDHKNLVEASHNGYKKFGVLHSRKWSIDNTKVVISDLVSKNRLLNTAHFHFHPDVVFFGVKENTISTSRGNITFVGATSIDSLDFEYALGFNKRTKSKKLQVNFKLELITLIEPRQN